MENDESKKTIVHGSWDYAQDDGQDSCDGQDSSGGHYDHDASTSFWAKSQNPAFDLELVVTEKQAESGMKVRSVLRQSQSVSQRLVRKIIHDGKGGGVWRNGVHCMFNEKVAAGDVIWLKYPDESSHILPENIPVEVLYEDDDLLAINKPAGIVVHPTKGHQSGTLANGIIAYMQAKGESYKPRFIGRLDMGTSGIILIGKNSHAQSSFVAQADKGLTEKRYIAVVHGVPEPRVGVIDEPILLREPEAPRRIVNEEGYPSRTHYEVSEILEGGKYAVVECELETGRTHQIRVHMAHIGCPLVGDELYGKSEPELLTRQALHAVSLSFEHPRTGEKKIIVAPMAADMINLMNSLK
jgi:23S rRNA pseudouridine1911/1915/1917 synthase